MAKVKESLLTLLAKIEADVVAAWSPSKVVYGEFPTEQASTGVPLASISVSLIDDDPQGEGAGVGQVEVEFQIEVSGRWPRPKGSTIEASLPVFLAERADDLTSLLMASPTYAGAFYLPNVDGRDLTQRDPQGPNVGLTVTFSCRACLPALTP